MCTCSNPCAYYAIITLISRSMRVFHLLIIQHITRVSRNILKDWFNWSLLRWPCGLLFKTWPCKKMRWCYISSICKYTITFYKGIFLFIGKIALWTFSFWPQSHICVLIAFSIWLDWIPWHAKNHHYQCKKSLSIKSIIIIDLKLHVYDWYCSKNKYLDSFRLWYTVILFW